MQNLSLPQWALAAFSCICFGVSKTGLSGVSVAAAPLFALVFGAKESTGIALPLLCFADLFAVVYYRRHAAWKYVWRLVPWALPGFGLALLADSFIDTDRGFKNLMGVCVAGGLAVMFWNDLRARKKPPAPGSAPVSTPAGAGGSGARMSRYAGFFGVLGGFSTMIGNSAGPVMSVFLLSVKLPKESFVGTAAWFFLIVNYLKIPLQVFVWRNISLETLRFDLVMIPFLLAGVALGVLIVKKVTDAQYRAAVYVLTLASAALLLI